MHLHIGSYRCLSNLCLWAVTQTWLIKKGRLTCRTSSVILTAISNALAVDMQFAVEMQWQVQAPTIWIGSSKIALMRWIAAFALAKALKHMFMVPRPMVKPHTTVYIADRMVPPVLQLPKGGEERQQSFMEPRPLDPNVFCQKCNQVQEVSLYIYIYAAYMHVKDIYIYVCIYIYILFNTRIKTHTDIYMYV